MIKLVFVRGVVVLQLKSREISSVIDGSIKESSDSNKKILEKIKDLKDLCVDICGASGLNPNCAVCTIPIDIHKLNLEMQNNH